MLNHTTPPSAAPARPLTHSDYLAACDALRGLAAPHPWVQVQKRYQGVRLVLCGQVVELSARDGEWFKLRTDDGMVWAEGRNVRMCSGDGRCTCESTGSGSCKC